MKRKFCLVFLSVFLFSSFVYAQSNNTINTTVNIQADVVQAIELITINTLSFNELHPEQKTLYINPVNDLNAGFMIALGTANAAFKIEFVPQHTITRFDGRGSINLNYEIAGSTIDNQATAEILKLENRNITFNGEGRYYFWIGGTLDIENAAPGNYQTDFTIEIDYI